MSPKPQPVQASGLDVDRTMKQALRLHQKGRLEQAEKRYAKILDADPAHAGALHLMGVLRSEEHTSELQSRSELVCRLLLEKKKQKKKKNTL